MPTYDTSDRYALRALEGGNPVSDIDAGFAALRNDISAKLTPYDSGLLSARPVSTGGTPGKAGRLYRATDDLTGGPSGTLYYDHGTGWLPLLGLDAKAMPGREIGYAEQLVTVTVSNSIEASPDSGGPSVLVVETGTLTLDGGPVWIEFGSPLVACPSGGGNTILTLWDGVLPLGRIANVGAGTNDVCPVHFGRRVTLSAGSHKLIVGAHRTGTGNGVVTADDGATTGHYAPTYLRVTKV